MFLDPMSHLQQNLSLLLSTSQKLPPRCCHDSKWVFYSGSAPMPHILVRSTSKLLYVFLLVAVIASFEPPNASEEPVIWARQMDTS